jgi:hypothetical protein
MNRGLIWALSPAPPIFVLALQHWAVRQSPEATDVWSIWILATTLVSVVFFFGAFPARYWAVSAVGAAVTLFGFSTLAAKLNVAGRIAGGAPENLFLELSAAVFVIAIPVAPLAAVLAGIVCGRGWLVRD